MSGTRPDSVANGEKLRRIIGDSSMQSSQVLLSGTCASSSIQGRTGVFNAYLYRLRRLVENVFLHLKRWRALLPVMRRIPHPSSPLSKAGVWLCGQMRWHERMSTRPDYIKDICKRRSPGMVTLAVSNFLHSRTVLVKGRSNRQVGKKIGGTTRFVLCI